MSATPETPSHNARSIIEAWRRGDSTHAWNEPARSMEPSATTTVVATAMRELSQHADRSANELVKAGFQPGHPHVRRMRETASIYAAESSRLFGWARDLAAAESELEESHD